MLLREYPSQIPVPLEVQDFEEWLDSLPGPYAPPRGRLLVVRYDGESAAVSRCGRSETTRAR
jgi:putative acetyltransferase